MVRVVQWEKVKGGVWVSDDGRKLEVLKSVQGEIAFAEGRYVVRLLTTGGKVQIYKVLAGFDLRRSALWYAVDYINMRVEKNG